MDEKTSEQAPTMLEFSTAAKGPGAHGGAQRTAECVCVCVSHARRARLGSSPHRAVQHGPSCAPLNTHVIQHVAKTVL